MNENVRFEAFYPHPPERVWRALVDPNALAQWLMPTDFKPELGFRFRFSQPVRGMRTEVQGEVVELQEGKRLRYTWDDGEAGSPSVVTWSLDPTEGGTRLRLEHESSAEAKPYVVIEAGINWRNLLYASLPVMLTLLRGIGDRPVPIVYVADAPEDPNAPPKKRAGFRQEETGQEKATCR